jgi:hypothetical protein
MEICLGLAVTAELNSQAHQKFFNIFALLFFVAIAIPNHLCNEWAL